MTLVVVCDDVLLCKLYDCFQLRAVYNMYVNVSIDCCCVVVAGTCTYIHNNIRSGS